MPSGEAILLLIVAFICIYFIALNVIWFAVWVFFKREWKRSMRERELNSLREEEDYRMKNPYSHFSDCAVHNEPAYPAGECDCGALPRKDS